MLHASDPLPLSQQELIDGLIGWLIAGSQDEIVFSASMLSLVI